MSQTTDRVIGTVKEVIGEIVGDGGLVEEGRAQRRPERRPSGASEKADELPPAENLNKLT